MFEQIIGQPAIKQIIADRTGGTLAPSMLFTGPHCAGKGTAGLELARVLSCEDPQAPQDCSCGACTRHRLLNNPDLLSLGPRNFSQEMLAAAAALQKKPESEAHQTFFIRSVRKLLVRFSPVLWEDEPKFSKLSDSVRALEEELNDFFSFLSASQNSAQEKENAENFRKKEKENTENFGKKEKENTENFGKKEKKENSGKEKEKKSKKEEAGPEVLKKRCDGILKTALKLEADGISDAIPIGQIRRSAAWSRLAPLGPRKLLLIENADRMQEGARNSLLKILEEPPERLTIILTTAYEKALLPTILSRVRPYRFVRRTPETEAEVIRLTFSDEPRGIPGIGAYLDSFLPVPEESLRPLAAFFAGFVAARTAVQLRNRGIALPPELTVLSKRAIDIAEAAGLGKPGTDTQSVILKITAGAEKFEIRGLFSRFLSLLAGLVSESGRTAGIYSGGYSDIWRKRLGEGAVGVSIYNQSPVSALERLSAELIRSLTVYFSV
ncbi:MAG: DNA polymerase III [Spirochaetaceae bacterium]|jgi:DNA polymerase-3 subunit gamma/tau|nr:DNA polymerase III [Spirochaetaceae bacterium]